MSETRVRAATLLSKVFLHYLVLLGEIDDGKELLSLWLKIITIMDRLINSGQGDNLVRLILTLHLVPPFKPIYPLLTTTIGRSRVRKPEKYAPRTVEWRVPCPA
jgi:hypothetical protein